MAAVLAVGSLIYFAPKRLTLEPNAAGVAPNTETASDDTYSTLSVYTDPKGARVIVGGDTVGVTPVENRRVPSGTYVVSVAKEGFVSRDTAMTLAADQSAVYAPQLSQEENVPGGEQRGASGLSTTEDVRPERSQPTASSQEAASTQDSYAGSPSGTNREQEAARERSPTPDPAAEGEAYSLVTGTLALSSDPAGTSIELNGYRVGTTPVRLDRVAAGTHEVTFIRPGYETVTKRVDVKGADTVTVEVSLTSKTGYLRVLVRPWGSIYVNGQRRMEAADVWYETELRAGAHTVTARHPALGEMERAVEVAASDTQSVVLDLREN